MEVLLGSVVCLQRLDYVYYRHCWRGDIHNLEVMVIKKMLDRFARVCHTHIIKEENT